MADEKREEGVYGENLENGSINDERGIREETVEAHPQPTGDASVDPAGADDFDADPKDAAADVRARGAEAIEGAETTPDQDLDAVRRGASREAGSGGMGREGTPRNQDGTTQGEFGDHDIEPVPG